MLNVANSKSVLAKLLAQENLSVQHRRVQTAYFDPKNRVLVLPIWKDMSNDLYDLLVGHEVGHAWETPPEGWHHAVTNQPKGFRSYLNVIEDARIERLIKNRYPGLRSSFYKAYNDLHQRDFFGLSKYNINRLPLIDRINVHYKLGAFLNTPFKDEEKVYLDRINNITSWDEVLQIALELYEKRKEETEIDLGDDLHYEEGDSSDWDDDGEYYDEFEDESEGIDGDSEREGGEDGNPDSKKTSRRGGGRGRDPKSLTDSIFRKREASLISDEIRPYVYADLALPVKWKECIVPHEFVYRKSLWEKMDNIQAEVKSWGLNDDIGFISGTEVLNEYKQRNSKYISYLVKEFELRRNASQYARASVSKTGELDVEQVWSYKFKDDIFKRVTKIPKGKNHGMVMFIDWSGSMSENLDDTIEQTLILADFCKKTNIPFAVYAFSDLPRKRVEAERNENFFPKVNNAVIFDSYNLSLLELMNNRMSVSAYNEAQKRLLQVAKIYRVGDYATGQKMNLSYELRRTLFNLIPKHLALGGTPLNEALVVAQNLVQDFKVSHKLDIINFIVLSDGEGNATNCVVRNTNRSYFEYEAKSKRYHLVLTDKKSGIVGIAHPGETVTHALLRMLKERCDANLVGFYILNRLHRGTIQTFLESNGKDQLPIESVVSSIKKEKFFDLSDVGYNKYFLVNAKDLEVAEDKIESDGKNKRELMRAFLKNQKRKLVNRVFLNKFIAEIA
jgi:hypothetical protein